MSASQTKNAVKSHEGDVSASRYSRRDRLRTTKNAILILVGLDAASSFLPMPSAMHLGMAVIAFIAALIGIAVIVCQFADERKEAKP